MDVKRIEGVERDGEGRKEGWESRYKKKRKKRGMGDVGGGGMTTNSAPPKKKPISLHRLQGAAAPLDMVLTARVVEGSH